MLNSVVDKYWIARSRRTLIEIKMPRSIDSDALLSQEKNEGQILEGSSIESDVLGTSPAIPHPRRASRELGSVL